MTISQDKLSYAAVTNKPQISEVGRQAQFVSHSHTVFRTLEDSQRTALHVFVQQSPGCFIFTAPSYQRVFMLAAVEKTEYGELCLWLPKDSQTVTHTTSVCIALAKANCMVMHNSKGAERPQKQRETRYVGEPWYIYHRMYCAY